jgi:hypothetical protein
MIARIIRAHQSVKEWRWRCVLLRSAVCSTLSFLKFRDTINEIWRERMLEFLLGCDQVIPVTLEQSGRSRRELRSLTHFII